MATITGGSGDDTLNGTSGIDSILGNGGNDSIFADGGYDTIDGGDGNDNIDAGGGADSVDGGRGDDTIYGRIGQDTLDGGDGNDFVDGGGSPDTVRGGAGNDTVIGGGGADIVEGGDGDDWLKGSEGDDTLTGGAGNDTFEFMAGGDNDTVTDFDLSDDDGDGKYNDQLDISGLTGGTGPGGAVIRADVTIVDDGFGNARLVFPGGETVVLQGVSPAQISSSQQLYAAGIPCFTPGTLIDTAKGPTCVEQLRRGDLVRTLDRGWQPVRWVGSRDMNATDLAAHPHLRPVIIRKGALGNARRMRVSAQHGFLFSGRLLRAKHLAQTFGGKVARVDRKTEVATYVHFLCDRHEIVFAEGIATESLYPGPMALRTMGQTALAELLHLFPMLASGLNGRSEAERVYGPTARPYMTQRELREANFQAERFRHPDQHCHVAA